MDKYIICVYGTLKMGKYWHALIADQRFIKKDSVKGRLYIDDRKLPVFTDGNKDIPVEVYEVSKEKFEMLTGFEENAGYKTVTTKTKSKQEVFLWQFSSKDVKDSWKEIAEY